MASIKIKTCQRCGIAFQIKPERDTAPHYEFCRDCRPEAKLLGWIPRKRATAA